MAVSEGHALDALVNAWQTLDAATSLHARGVLTFVQLQQIREQMAAVYADQFGGDGGDLRNPDVPGGIDRTKLQYTLLAGDEPKVMPFGRDGTVNDQAEMVIESLPHDLSIGWVGRMTEAYATIARWLGGVRRPGDVCFLRDGVGHWFALVAQENGE